MEPREVRPQLQLVALLVLVSWLPPVLGDYCYMKAIEGRMNVGVKTAYYPPPNLMTRIPSSKTERCRPVMVWMMTKHGTSWPSNGELETSFSQLPNIKDFVSNRGGFAKLCKEDQTLLNGWQYIVRPEDAGNLHATGAAGLHDLGVRMKKSFPGLFKKPFSTDDYIVQYGKEDWRLLYDSANSFVRGLFTQSQTLKSYDEYEDLVLQLQKCKPAVKPVYESPEGTVSVSNIKVVDKSYDNVRERLSTPQLSNSEIDAIFFACAQEKSWEPTKKSPWCTLLTPDDIKAQEYVEDFIYYYQTAYKDDFGKKAVCPVIKDMLTRFKLYTENPTCQHPKGIFYFGLTKHINLVTTGLNFMYEPNYLKMTSINQNRKYRTSKFMGFMGNLMAILHECKNRKNPNIKSYKVKFFINEEPIKEVSLNALLKEHENYVNSDDCNFDFCNENDADERISYRQDHPVPVGVDLRRNPPPDPDTDISAEDTAKTQKKSGHKWWYWVLFPFILICAIPLSAASSVL